MAIVSPIAPIRDAIVVRCIVELDNSKSGRTPKLT